MRHNDRSTNIHSAPQRSSQNPYSTNSSGTTKSPTKRIPNDCKKGKSDSGRVKKNDATFGKIGICCGSKMYDNTENLQKAMTGFAKGDKVATLLTWNLSGTRKKKQRISVGTKSRLARLRRSSVIRSASLSPTPTTRRKRIGTSSLVCRSTTVF